MKQAKQSQLPDLVREQDGVRDMLTKIDEAKEPGDGTRTHIVLADGRYLSGVPYFGSSNWNRAFFFRDKKQADALIAAFPIVLKDARSKSLPLE